MFGNSKEYQDIKKLYEEKVSKPVQLDELKAGPGPNTPPKKTTSFGDAIKMNQNRSATTTSTPKMSTSGAQITTNQRQSRDLASKNKDVKLNKFSRTKTYGADAKGVKLVPGAKVGQQVNRSTVQTKAEFDFGGVKKGERLGVMTRNQRRKYDLMAAQRAKKTEPKPDIKPIDANPFQGGPKTEKPVEKPVENKGKLRGGQGGRPLGDTTRRQGGTVKSGVTLFKKGEDAKKFTDKTGFASKVDTVKGKDPKPERRPMGRSAAKRRQMAASRTRTNTNTGTGTETNTQIKKFPGSGKEINPKAKVTQTTSTNDKGQKVTTTTAKTSLQGSEATDAIRKAKEEKAKRMQKANSVKEEYDAYDIVLEYLLSSEQAATIEEANYIMTEMDAETIQGIVSEGLGSAIKKVVKKGMKKLKGGEMKGDFPTKGDGSYTA